jgi:hypothetical protein
MFRPSRRLKAGRRGGTISRNRREDSNNNPSGTGTVILRMHIGVLWHVDQTKLPADTLTVPMQVLDNSSGQPAPAGNLSLVYHSSTQCAH